MTQGTVFISRSEFILHLPASFVFQAKVSIPIEAQIQQLHQGIVKARLTHLDRTSAAPVRNPKHREEKDMGEQEVPMTFLPCALQIKNFIHCFY